MIGVRRTRPPGLPDDAGLGLLEPVLLAIVAVLIAGAVLVLLID